MLDGMIWLWIGFNLFVLAMLALDLGVFHRHAHVVSLREATVWSIVWITLSLLFNFGIYLFWDRWVPGSEYTNQEAAIAFLTGYVIEKSLSVDNIFVFVLIFAFFRVPAAYQHRVLFWGILGALVMRAILIAVGAALIKEFHWIIYVFGAFLVYTGIRMARHEDEEIEPEKNPVVRLFRRFMPVTPNFEQDHFFVRHGGQLMATPLFVVLLLVESTDLIFAVDSIPAIFAVTTDTFLVYTSNVCAILGLRSLYFLLAGVMDKFYYLKLGLSVILSFVGVKMLMTDIYKIPIMVSLAVIVSILIISVLASLWRTRRYANQPTEVLSRSGKVED
ncbi:MAG: TerC family protein [Caldilineaceae bacterium]|nr:TerC family protein [Caldilineaceae bacterium]MCB0144772.1 TerC family protein [Caldilineaceae bacterium]